MVEFDIGAILFREILRMYEYPGAPFTGDVIRDVVTYFFVPTVFLIVVIFFATGIVLGPAWRGLRLLFGLAAYLFVIVSGYYSVFAYVAGPYFFVLIIVVGLVYFLMRHFRTPTLRGGGGGAPAPGAPRMPGMALAPGEIMRLRARLAVIDKELRDKQAEFDMLTNRPGGDKAAAIVREEIANLRREKNEITHILEPWKKYGLAA